MPISVLISLVKRAETRTDICTLVFTSALSTIGKRWEQPKRPWTDGRMKDAWSIHATKYGSTLRRGDSLPRPATGMNFRTLRSGNKPATRQTLSDSTSVRSLPGGGAFGEPERGRVVPGQDRELSVTGRRQSFSLAKTKHPGGGW